MRLKTIGMALVRRWYAMTVGLLIVAGGCYYLYATTPLDYRSTGSIVLMPSAGSVGKSGNPYLFLNGLGQAMDVLMRRLSSPDLSSGFTHGHPGSSYTVAPDVTSGSSILVVTAKSTSSEETTAMVETIIAKAPSVLAAMQDELKVPAESRISSMQVADIPNPVVDAKPRIQKVAGAAAGGSLLVLLGTALLDGLILRASRRRSGANGSSADRIVASALKVGRVAPTSRSNNPGPQPASRPVPEICDSSGPDEGRHVAALASSSPRTRWVFGEHR